MTGALFRDELLRVDAANSETLAGVLARAGDRGGPEVRTADLLAAVIERADAAVGDALRAALAPGATPRDVLETIAVYAPPSATPTAFDGRRTSFAPEALAALDCAEGRLAEPGRAAVAAELLLVCVLRHLADADREALLTILDVEEAIRRLERRIDPPPPEPLLDGSTGRLRSEVFAVAAWQVLEQAAVLAGQLGYDRLLPPHCLLALLGETEGPADRIVRLEAGAGVGPVQVADAIAEGFRLASARSAPPELDRHGIGEPLLEVLEAAERSARLDAADRIQTHHLLHALLADPPTRLRSLLEGFPLELDLARLRERTREFARGSGAARRETPFRLPPGLLASEDLTHLARADELQPALHVERYLEPALRALARRRQNHVLLTAAPGVGATSVVRELARRAAGGELAALARKRFLRVDCSAVAPEDSRDALVRVLAHVAARTDVVLCLDGLGAMLRGPGGTDHRPVLRSAVTGGQAHIVGVMTEVDFRDLVAGDPALSRQFTRIEIAEPSGDEVIEIVGQRAQELEQEFGLRIGHDAVERAVALTADYAISERLPTKAVNALLRACENADFERQRNGASPARVAAADVVGAVADLTGVPVGMLSGASGRVDYDSDLATAVVGQDEAVRTVAGELRQVSAGLVIAGRPAAVLMFVGPTGVGKTELAKAIAGLYSASRRLQTYSMANFVEPHSVSGIIGVPPGYHGHQLGGRLINDLNADPYCVILLDEAEKAHPDVWKPFLSLFDEGWIVDQRGVKAYGDRALFILATNAGYKEITDRAAGAWSGRPGRPRTAPERSQVAARVRDALAEQRHAHTGERVFSPEFLARIGRIVVFEPLDRAAMSGVCRIEIERMTALWRRRGKTLTVAPKLIDHIGERAYELDEAAGNTEGGRVVRRLIDDLVQGPIMDAIDARIEDAAAAAVIAVGMRSKAAGEPEIRVELRAGGDDDG